MAIRRFHRLLTIAALLLAAWLYACSQAAHADITDWKAQLVYLSPVLLIVAWGAYAFVLLVFGVASFRSVPSAAESLRSEMQEAQSFLRAHHVPTAQQKLC
eukprot:TRINITY_DN13803_c0_g1_i1.p1 TRINITY_DN13803_c0_g1~~TRINITY_DN13803_c0_g1_i1.p1  ORF type:complete len:101 (-),score=5.75 TRINITY_DN13803_c0_g1_i1:110-412(-)